MMKLCVYVVYFINLFNTYIMKKVLFLFQIVTAIGVYAQQNGSELIIRLQGVNPDGRKLMIGVGDLKKDPQKMRGGVVIADSTVVVCSIKDLPEGKHFVYVYHDANENQKLDFTESVKPAEGVAVDDKYSWEPSVQINGSAQTIDLNMYYFNK